MADRIAELQAELRGALDAAAAAKAAKDKPAQKVAGGLVAAARKQLEELGEGKEGDVLHYRPVQFPLEVLGHIFFERRASSTSGSAAASNT